jgi:DNA repair protein SbcC/Rad50
MYIKSLTLQNIRSYTDVHIAFPKGIILLSGDIGSGKSTILQAIEFALFGTQRSELSGSSLLRNGENKGEVELTFVINGVEYCITRSLARTKKSVAQQSGAFSVVLQSGAIEKIDLSTTELNTQIATVLGYTQPNLAQLLYRYTVYTSQERMKEIVFELPQKRLETLRAIFGIDKFKTVSENSQIVIKELRSESLVLAERCIDLADLQKQVQTLEQQKHDCAQNQNKLQSHITTVTQKLHQTQSELTKLDETIEKAHAQNQKQLQFALEQKQLKNQIATVTEQITTLQHKIDHIQSLPIPQKIELEPILKQKLELEQYKAQYTKSITEFEQQSKRKLELQKQLLNLDAVDTKQQNLELQLAHLQKKLSEFPQRPIDTYEQAQKQLFERLTQTKTNLENQTKNLDVLSLNSCPTCQQKITQDYKLYLTTQTQNQTTELQLAVESLSKKLEMIENSRQTIKQAQLEFDTLTQNKEILQVNIAALSEQLRAKNDILSQLDLINTQTKVVPQDKTQDLQKITHDYQHALQKQKECDTFLQAKVQAEQHKQTIIELQISIRELIQQLEKLQASPVSGIEIAPILREKQHTQERLKQNQTEVQKCASELSALATQQVFIQTQIAELQQKIELKILAKEEMTQKNNQREWLKQKFVPLLNQIERASFSQSYHLTNAAYSKWFSLLLEDETMQSRLDETFTPILVQDGYELPIDYLSGGEKTSVALAYRLALNHVINTMSTELQTKGLLILDEPTDGFSSEQLDRVRDVLLTLHAEQIILVSHESKVESFVHTIFRVHKNDHQSEIVLH